MAGDAEELPPLVQNLIARYDASLSQPQFDKMNRGQQDAVRDMNKSLERLAKSAAMRQARILAEEMRRQNEVVRKSYQQREKLALTAGKREGEIVKATSREVVVAHQRASTQEVVAQRKASNALVVERRKGMARWEEVAERAYFRMRGKRQKANQQESQDQQRSNRSSRDDQARAFKTWFAQFDDFLKRRRAKERAAQFEHLANQKAAHRAEWQAQKSADSRSLAAQKAGARANEMALKQSYYRANQVQAAQLERQVNAHKAMWSVIRTATETGGRFMASITQSFLRSMGQGVTRGLSRITGTFRREGEQQQSALRSNYAQQEQITRRAMVRQQGIVQGFQTRNAAVTQGGAGGGPIGALMSVRNMLLGAGAFISARAIFGPIMDYQQTKIAFEGILQSSTAAEAMLTQLQNFAKVTPFTFAGIADSAKQLLAVGYAAEDVIPMMTTLGDTAAGLGLGEDAISGVIRALGQMKGKGKASAEEMNQISEQLPGFSAIGAVADSMGITVAEAFAQMKQGAIPADLAIEAILEGMREMPGAAGAMERQSRTLTGRLSTLKDTIQILLIKAMDPFIDSIATGVGLLTTFLDNLFNAGGVFKVVRSALMGLAIALGSMLAYQGVVLMLDGIKLALLAIAANPAIVVFTGLVTAMVLLYRHVPAVTEVVNDMRDAFMAFFTGTREALGLLMDGDFPAFFDQMQSLGEDLLAALAPSANVIRDFFADAFDRARNWIEAGGLGVIGEKIGAALTAVADSPAVEWLVEFGEASWQRWQDWLDSGGLGDLADAIKMRLLDAFAKVSDALGGIDWEQLLAPALAAAAVVVAGLILGWPLVIGAALVAALVILGPRLRDGITKLFSKAKDWITETFDRIDWGEVGLKVLDGIRRVGEFIGGPVVEAIFSKTGWKIIGAVAAAVGAFALGLLQGLAHSVPKGIRNLFELIQEEGFSRLQDLADGTMFEGITGALTEALGQLFTNVADELDFIGALISALTGNGDWSEVGDALEPLIGDLFESLLATGGLVRNVSDFLNQLLTSALSNLSSGVTEWSRGLEGPFGALVQIIAAPFAGLWGIISDVLNRVRDFVRGWIDVIVGLFTGDFGRVFDGMRAVWGSLLGLARDFLGRIQTAAWSVFTGLGQLLWDGARAGLRWLKEKFLQWGEAVIGFWTGLPQTIADAFVGFGGLLLDAIKSGFEVGGSFAAGIVNGIIDFINTRVLDWISGRSIDMPIGPDINFPDLPHIRHLAKGGIVTGPTIALIGEAGPEAVVPLSDGMGQIPLTILFDTTTIAAQVAAVAAILAPLGERISAATMPGLVAWVAAVNVLLDGMESDFKDWGKSMVAIATVIGTSIAGAMGTALREGRGEVTQIVRGYGRNLAGALNPLLAAIGEQPVALNFAKGGIAEGYEGAQVHVFNEGRRGRGSSHGEAYIPFDPANKTRSRALAAETTRRLGGEVQWYAKGGLSPDAIRRGQSFARAQDGKPYVWGGVGPNGYDCSGLASAIINAVRGQDPYHRLFTSGSLVAGASAGLLPGLGQVSVGARSGRPGHVSSTIAGLNAESTGDHVRIGAAARSAADFPSRWHLGSGVFIGPEGTTYPLPAVPAVGHGDLGRLGSGWMRYVRRKSKAFVDANTFTGLAFGGPESGVPTGMQVGDGSPGVMAAIRRAMSVVGVPSSWLGPLLTLIGRESSFNPRAYNGILGASGLMQTIPSTFAAHALPGYGGIFDPVANVIAGLRYILGRYGSIFNVGQATSPHPTRGYSYGGVTDHDGPAMLHRNEVVLPLGKRARLTELLRRTGLDRTIALAASPDPTADWSSVDSATSRSAARTIPDVTVNQSFHTNAMDERTVATISARKTAKEVRRALVGIA